MWIRSRYGVFDEIETARPAPTSRQYALCRGRSARAVVLAHTDFASAAAMPRNYTQPTVRLVRRAVPKFVILLENSMAMDRTDNWEYIRTACRKGLHTN